MVPVDSLDAALPQISTCKKNAIKQSTIKQGVLGYESARQVLLSLFYT